MSIILFFKQCGKVSTKNLPRVQKRGLLLRSETAPSILLFMFFEISLFLQILFRTSSIHPERFHYSTPESTRHLE